MGVCATHLILLLSNKWLGSNETEIGSLIELLVANNIEFGFLRLRKLGPLFPVYRERSSYACFSAKLYWICSVNTLGIIDFGGFLFYTKICLVILHGIANVLRKKIVQ